MKKLFAFLMMLALAVNTSNAAFTEKRTATESNYGVFHSSEQKKAAEAFVNLSRKDYEALTGRHLSLMERLAFKMTQKHLKHELKKIYETRGFNIGGFMMGFLLSFIGILLAYAFSNDTNVHRWAWVGAIANLIIFILIII